MIKSFVITIILCFFVINSVSTLVPSPRAEQAAILVNNKIYFYGGFSESSMLYDLFYLDVSSSFFINDMPWHNLPSPTDLPPRTASTACTYGGDKNQITYISGSNIAGDNFTTVYDITTQHWSTPKTIKNFTKYRALTQCVVSDNDIYVYGGQACLNDMIKLDTLILNWTELPAGQSSAPPPIGVQGYSATLLNNTSILYIGGQPGGDVQTLPYTSFEQLSMYNINDNTWSSIATSGNIPPSRYDHGGVFIPQYNQNLILYGYPISSNPIMALDTVKFEWSIPTIKNVGPTIGLRRFTSILIGTYIFIAFGAFDTKGVNSTNNFFLLDVSQKNNYVWVASYNPTKTFQSVPTTTITSSATSISSPNNSATPSNFNNDTPSPYDVGKIIGIVFGAIAGIIILSAAAVLIIRKHNYYHNFTL